MEVLHIGHLIPFHNHSPVSQDSVGFPFYSLGPSKAQALQAEVGKMLEEGALQIVSLPGPGCCSYLFLVQKVTGEWRPTMSLGSQSLCDPYSFQDRDGDFSLGVDQERGHDILTCHEECIPPDTHSPGLSTVGLPLDCFVEQGLPIQHTFLWPVHSHLGLHQAVLSSVRVGSLAGDSPSLMLQ